MTRRVRERYLTLLLERRNPDRNRYKRSVMSAHAICARTGRLSTIALSSKVPFEHLCFGSTFAYDNKAFSIIYTDCTSTSSPLSWTVQVRPTSWLLVLFKKRRHRIPFQRSLNIQTPPMAYLSSTRSSRSDIDLMIGFNSCRSHFDLEAYSDMNADFRFARSARGLWRSLWIIVMTIFEVSKWYFILQGDILDCCWSGAHWLSWKFETSYQRTLQDRKWLGLGERTGT